MGVLCFVLAMQYFLAIIALGKRELVAVYVQSCDCKCSVSLPHGVVGWSAVCDCDIFWTLRFKNCAQHCRLPDVIPHISWTE